MPYQQINRAALRAQAYDRLGRTGQNFWRDDELNRLINEALRMWNCLTGYWRVRDVSVVTVANQVWYPLPSTITSQMRVEWQAKPLGYSALADLDNGRPAWEGETTADGGDVPSEVAVWAPAGLNLIAIWPADAAGNAQLVLDGIAATPVLTLDADFIDIGSEELSAILDYIEHAAVFKEGGAEFTSTGTLLESFLKAAAERNSLLMASAPFRRWLGIHQDEARVPRRTAEERIGAR